jgi:serine/threonine protein kinase
LRVIGKTIAHYKILEKLGEGGMGIVYKAEDLTLGRTVALKFLPPELTRDPAAKERFKHEARAASALDHPNICTIHEISETEDGQMFIAMACYEGETLRKKIEHGPMDPHEAIRTAIQIGEGLAKAHGRGIVHRDIKPANVMITDDNVAKILDFGLAMLAGQVRLTKTPSTLGTVAYMSPEQAGGREIDHRTDIWSLGVVLYEMIAGQLPFRGEHEQAMMYSILNEEPVPLVSRHSDLPKEILAVLEKALAKDRARRYQQMGEMISDLRSCGKKLEDAKASAGVSKPKRFKKLLPYVITGCAVLVAVIILGRVYLFAPHEKAITSLAVLPFQNLSADPEQEYFSDGMTEALIGELSKIKALRVISRTSIMRYKKTDKSLPQIAGELGVDAVVEGSVQRVGNDVRITAQLIAARPEKHLWADDFTRNLENILELQSEVAQAIAREIKITVTPEELTRLAKVRTVNPEAHEAYLRGMFYANKFSPPDAFRSIGYFERAVEIDSTYALAYAGLGMAYDILASMSVLPAGEAWPKVKTFSAKALSLDETLPEAYILIADTKLTYDWDFKGAEEYFKRALELNSNSAMGHSWYSNYLISQGKFDDAIKEAQIGRNLDPMSCATISCLAAAYLYTGQFDSALTYVNEALSIDSANAFASFLLTQIQIAKGMYEQAIPRLQMAIASGDSTSLDVLCFAYAASGQRAKARETLEELTRRSKRRYVSALSFAMTHCALGDTARVFEYLEKAYEERNPMMPFLLAGPMPRFCEYVRDDQRFHALVKRVGLEE